MQVNVVSFFKEDILIFFFFKVIVALQNQRFKHIFASPWLLSSDVILLE